MEGGKEDGDRFFSVAAVGRTRRNNLKHVATSGV